MSSASTRFWRLADIMPSLAVATAAGSTLAGSRKRRRRVERIEGTTAGDGVRRLCFCPRHRSKAPPAAVLHRQHPALGKV